MKFESAHIKKGDMVKVIAGRDKGKSGKILAVLPKRERVVIEKINMVKRHTKPSNKLKQGGIVEKELPLNWSNVMLVCGKCNKPVRIKHKMIGENKNRACVKCGEFFDAK